MRVWLRNQWIWDLQHIWKYTIRDKWTNKLLMFIAWNLPRPLIAWCYIRVAAHATTGKYGNTLASNLGMMEALKRWEDQEEPYAPNS